jgi:hypothetical protein
MYFPEVLCLRPFSRLPSFVEADFETPSALWVKLALTREMILESKLTGCLRDSVSMVIRNSFHLAVVHSSSFIVMELETVHRRTPGPKVVLHIYVNK